MTRFRGLAPLPLTLLNSALARREHRAIQLLAVLMGAMLLAAPGLHAQQKPNEYQVKAVYLYNFARFVAWPSNGPAARNDNFTICVLGQDPFGSALDALLAGETIDGKSVVAKRISSPQESGSCRILFLSSAEDGRMNKVIEALDKEEILTVSDLPEFAQRGGMIQFVLEGKKVRFEVNLTAVEHAGLVLSSELLKVATTVRRTSPTGD